MKRLFFYLIFFPFVCLALDLPEKIQAVIERVNQDLHVGMEVVSLEEGRVVYERNSKQLFVPASLHKVYTAGAAFSILGEEFRFETKLCSEAAIEKGCLQGPLYLVGSGDPSFSSKDLFALAERVRGLGIQKISGDLILDLSEFDESAMGPGWMWDEPLTFGNSIICPLTLDHNCMEVTILASDFPGKSPHIVVSPEASYLQVENCATILPAEHPECELHFVLKERTEPNLFQLRGEISRREEALHRFVPVREPHMVFARRFFGYATRLRGGN